MNTSQFIAIVYKHGSVSESRCVTRSQMGKQNSSKDPTRRDGEEWYGWIQLTTVHSVVEPTEKKNSVVIQETFDTNGKPTVNYAIGAGKNKHGNQTTLHSTLHYCAIQEQTNDACFLLAERKVFSFLNH